MPSLPSVQTLMLFCLLGALVALSTADGVPRQKSSRPKPRQGHTSDDASSQPHIETVKLLLDPGVLKTNDPIPQLANHSLSPWTYSTSHDPSRFPSDIAQAKCVLIGCQNAEGREVMHVESRPILQQMLVLRRVEGNGQTYFYKLESKTVTVGCTCVRPNTVQQK